MRRFSKHISFILAIGLLVLVNLNALHYLLVEHTSSQTTKTKTINNKQKIHNCDDFILNNIHFIGENFNQKFTNPELYLYYKHQGVNLVHYSNYRENNLGRDPPFLG